MRKISGKALSSLLALLLILGFCSPQSLIAFATDDTPTINVSSVEGRIGGIVDVTVSLKNNPGFTGMIINVSYDDSALKLIYFRDTEMLNNSDHLVYDDGTSPARFTWVDATARVDNFSNGVIVELRFEILPDATVDNEYELTMNFNQAISTDLTRVYFTPVSGIVTVREACKEHVEAHQHKAPTCMTDGYDRTVCAVCNAVLSFKTLPALGGSHALSMGVIPATCIAEGGSGGICTKCDELVMPFETYPIDPTNHAGETYKMVIKPATSTEYGVMGIFCADCFVQIDTRTIGKLACEHKWNVGVITTPATCEDEGVMTYTCELCGETRTEAITATGHIPVSESGPATCTEDGYLRVTCFICGEVLSETVFPATGHDYVAVVTAPTCTEDGYTTYTCSVCGDSYVGDNVDALGHDWNSGVVTKAPTEYEDGVMTYTCLRCGETRTEAIPALGHHHSHTAVVIAPTCTEGGYTTYTCTCGDIYVDEYVDPLGHDYVTYVTVPTCTEQGFTTYACSVCGDSYVDDYIPAHGHIEETETMLATCTEDGYFKVNCTVCGEVLSETIIPAAGHDYVAVITAPTCTEDGYTTYTCPACGDSYVDDYVDALGHDWDDGVVTIAPTEYEDGLMTYTCLRCGETRTEPIPALGHEHSYTEDVTAPTCTEQGYTTYTCSCGDSYVDDYVDAHGHDYAAVITAPTCTEDGYTTYTCSCGDSYVGDYVDAHGHDFDLVDYKAPTADEDGCSTYKCIHCDEIRTIDIPALILESIVISNLPAKTDYLVGESLDLTGIILTAIYNDDSEEVLKDFSTNPSDGTILSNAGAQNITVIYTKNGIVKTVDFIITVSLPEPEPKPDVLSVSVTTPTVVETLAAYLNIIVAGENLDRNNLTAYLKVGEELLYTTPIINGKGRMFIEAAPEAGKYEIVVIDNDRTAEGSFLLDVTEYDTDIWTMNIMVNDEGYVVLMFNEAISAKDGTFNRKLNLNNKTITCVLSDDSKSLITDTKADNLDEGANTFTVTGVKYPRLFPSYSFTFTAQIDK